ncbi:hypothetical protein JCM8547_005918 [Rhodosporidiobolus lusitaniae]
MASSTLRNGIHMSYRLGRQVNLDFGSSSLDQLHPGALLRARLRTMTHSLLWKTRSGRRYGQGALDLVFSGRRRAQHGSTRHSPVPRHLLYIRDHDLYYLHPAHVRQVEGRAGYVDQDGHSVTAHDPKDYDDRGNPLH